MGRKYTPDRSNASGAPRSAPTTTSYAILGELALRPWAAYDLAKEMTRNVHFFWPRAESRIYDQLKRLAELGLAMADQSRTGRRTRTTYTITDAGRASLESWLATSPTRGIGLESEALLRVLLANLGETDTVRSAIEAARADALEICASAGRIGREYLEGRAPFQELVKHRALVYDFLTSYALAVADWADRADAAVEAWGELDDEAAQQEALAAIRQRRGQVEARLARSQNRD